PQGNGVHFTFSLLSSTVPTIVALFADWWIGDGYAGSWQWNGESAGVHVISLAGELALVTITLACAITAKQVVNDKSRQRMLITGLIALAFFSLASATAQWFLILKNVQAVGYDPSSSGILAMLLLRVLIP